MSREFRSLLQKEWAERRATIWYATICLLVCLGYGIAYEIEFRTRTFIASTYHVMHLFALVGSIFLSIGTVRGEYTQRTLKFSAALPISLGRVAWVRLLGLWACLIIPILVGAAVSSVLLGTGFIQQAEFRPHELRLPDRPSTSAGLAIGMLWISSAVAIAHALELATILCLIGTWCRRDATVGLIGAVVGPLFDVFGDVRAEFERRGLYWLADWIGALMPNTMLVSYGFGDSDGALYSDLDVTPVIVAPLIISLLLTLIIAWVFTRRYGRRNDSTRAIVRQRPWLAWLPRFSVRLPMMGRSETASLVWLAMRQSVALSLCGLAIAVVIALVSLFEQSNTGPVSTIARLRGAIPSQTWYLGILWASVVAVGVFASELKPDLERFWRSRPISPATWFWVKFFVGLIAVIAALDLIPAIVGWNQEMPPTSNRMGIVFLACMPLQHSLVYALAVAGISRWRRPVPAGIAAVLLYFAFDVIIQSIPVYPSYSPIHVYNRLEAGQGFDPVREGFLITYGAILGIAIIATLLARRQIVPAVTTTRVAGLIVSMVLFCGGQSGFSQEAVSVDQLIQGMQRRHEQIHDLHLKLHWERHRTDTFYEQQRASRSQARLRREPVAKPEPREEEGICELFQRGNSIAWTLSNSDGSFRRRRTIDGESSTDYEPHRRSSPRATVSTSSQDSHPPILTAEQGLMQESKMIQPVLSLPVRMRNGKFQLVSDRTVDGERLVDFVVDVSYMRQGQVSEHETYNMTMNLTRNYWPVHIRHEIFDGDSLFLVFEVTANGWIESNGINYPQKVTQEEFVLLPAQSTSGSASAKELKLRGSQSVDVVECSINQGVSDDVLKPRFPPGTEYTNQDSGVLYRVDTAGVGQVFQPLPKGIRGATFVYHLIWITGAVAYFFGRCSQISVP